MKILCETCLFFEICTERGRPCFWWTPLDEAVCLVEVMNEDKREFLKEWFTYADTESDDVDRLFYLAYREQFYHKG